MNTAVKQRMESKMPLAPVYRATPNGINGRRRWSAMSRHRVD